MCLFLLGGKYFDEFLSPIQNNHFMNVLYCFLFLSIMILIITWDSWLLEIWKIMTRDQTKITLSDVMLIPHFHFLAGNCNDVFWLMDSWNKILFSYVKKLVMKQLILQKYDMAKDQNDQHWSILSSQVSNFVSCLFPDPTFPLYSNANMTVLITNRNKTLLSWGETSKGVFILLFAGK